MGRPDLTEIRRREILDAFEECVGRYGLEASSLEMVAKHAGMKRSILRHYIGNRDDLVVALAERVVAKYRQAFEAFGETITENDRVEAILSYFFPSQPIETTADILVVESLIAASEQLPRVRELMFGYVDGLVTSLAKHLILAFPKAGKQRCWRIAYGVVSVCFNQESLAPMQLPPRYLRSARYCAQLMIQSLAY